MTIGKRFFCFLAIVASPFLTPVRGLPCTCFDPSPAPGKTMREVVASRIRSTGGSTMIFEGVVEKQEIRPGSIGAPTNAMSMTAYGEHRVVMLRVSRTYRGSTPKITTVLTGIGNGDCGYDFETGKEYLVYADPIQGGALFTSICARTAPLEQSGPELRFLRGEPPSADDLLDPSTYYKKYSPQWTGTVCGRVMMPDGNPLPEAMVAMSQVRDEPLPPEVASDLDLSGADGSFCVEGIRPGKYLLTAETYDFGAKTRWMGYYPGVIKHLEAVPLEVHGGDNLSDLHFTVQKQVLYKVVFRVVTPDGSPLLGGIGVAIDSPDRDPLAYHESHELNQDGSYTLNLIPPGHYFMGSYIEPDFPSGQVPAEASKWRMAKQEVDISGDTEVVIQLIPSN